MNHREDPADVHADSEFVEATAEPLLSAKERAAAAADEPEDSTGGDACDPDGGDDDDEAEKGARGRVRRPPRYYADFVMSTCFD